MHQADNQPEYPTGLLLKAIFFFAVALLLFSCVTKIAFLFWIAFIVLGLFFAGLALYLVINLIALIFG